MTNGYYPALQKQTDSLSEKFLEKNMIKGYADIVKCLLMPKEKSLG